MKKFEIINNNWIHQFAFKGDSSDVIQHNQFMKISSVSYMISKSLYPGDKLEHFIAIRNDGGQELCLNYSKVEGDQYKADLLFLSELLLK